MGLAVLPALDSAGPVDPDQIYNDIHDIADQLRSLAVSIREAAFRQNGAWLRIHRAEFVQQAQLLNGLIKDLSAPVGDGGAR